MEEASALGAPTFILRDTTERTEAVEGGYARLIGTDCECIVKTVSRYLDNAPPINRFRKINAATPYGDGLAARRIADILSEG